MDRAKRRAQLHKQILAAKEGSSFASQVCCPSICATRCFAPGPTDPVTVGRPYTRHLARKLRPPDGQNTGGTHTRTPSCREKGSSFRLWLLFSPVQAAVNAGENCQKITIYVCITHTHTHNTHTHTHTHTRTHTHTHTRTHTQTYGILRHKSWNGSTLACARSMPVLCTECVLYRMCDL